MDIRSTTVTSVIGEAGVNHTFLIRGSQAEMYDGYGEGRFFSEEDLRQCVYTALTATAHSASERHATIYVGVPSGFTYTLTKTHKIAFSAAKRVSAGDVETLLETGFMGVEIAGYEKVHASAMYYVTSDTRKVMDPIGMISNTLQANISYSLVSTYFTQTIGRILTDYGFKKIIFVPSSYAQARYLLNESKRASGAVILDVGTTSSTMTAFYGDGILTEEEIPYGVGNILMELMATFDWSYERAFEELKRANVYRRTTTEKYLFGDAGFIRPERINEVIISGLDRLSLPLSGFLSNCPPLFTESSLFVTGEGAVGMRGSLEHISRRCNKEAELLVPNLPYYDKPSMSSRIALLDYAIKNKKADGIFRKLLNGFGG